MARVGFIASLFKLPRQRNIRAVQLALVRHARSILRSPPDGARLVIVVVLAVLVTALAWPLAGPTRVGWEQLLAPYSQGAPLGLGYRLLPPRHGEEHDIVILARRDPGPGVAAAQVEVHVLDRGRWTGVRETRSFGVAYESPLSSAPEPEREAVTETIAATLRAHDTGFPSVDSIPLRSDPPLPALSRSLQRLDGAGGALCALAFLAILAVLVPTRFGPLAVTILLVALGGLLRFSHLDVPFVHDQDVQRVLSGHGPWLQVLWGVGLRDRHPPLFFAVLHVVEWLGQGEALVRAPAALAGALTGPAVIWAVWRVRRRVGLETVATAFAVTVSPELVARSREVSEVPLFGLIAIIALAVTTAEHQRVTRWQRAAVAASHAALLWLYYLAPLSLGGQWLALSGTKRPARTIARAALAGVVAGIPSLGLLTATLFRDYGARRVAERFPALAWGSQSPAGMVRAIANTTVEAFGIPLLLVWTSVLVAGLWRTRDRAVLASLGAFFATVAGICVLTPVARVQPYYVVAVLPLLALAVCLVPTSEVPRAALARRTAFLAAACVFVPLRLPSSAAIYLPSAEAFMPAFASAAASRPEKRLVTVAHYDATLLYYYLCRRAGAEADWSAVDQDGTFRPDATGKRIIPLAMTHGLTGDAGQIAASRLAEATGDEPVLVVDRLSFQLPEVARMLERCTVIESAPTARLVACAASEPPRPAGADPH